MFIAVIGGTGRAAPVSVRSLRLVRRSTSDHSERLKLSSHLPAGSGKPDAVSVHFPAGVGGGDFATYWPFSQGLRAQITQGPGGSYSHYTIYTRDAVDVGVPTGTLIRAGFTGVIARVNTGCLVGQLTCGSGYGNYIYLKASDGTCAVMAHMSRLDVSYGQQVDVYTPLGLSGGTGDVSGPHLHYDHVNCSNNRSLPWAPIEGGSLQQGATIISQNHPPGEPCTALQGGCAGPIQGSNNPLQGSNPPLQGGGPGAGGGSGSGSVTLTQGPAAPSGYRYAINLSGFGAHQSVSIVCYDSTSPSGFYSFGLTTDATGNASTSSSCYSGDGPDHWVVANGVQSNHVSWGAGSSTGGGSTPTPTPNPTPTPMPGGEFAVQNASGGIYWRSSPDWSTAEAVAGNGFYPGTVISVSCYQSGAANVPGSTDSMWERATWVSGPGSGNGWINEHFINDGSGINQPSPGVPPCSSPPPSPPPPPPPPPPSHTFSVMNASGGIYWRSGPDWNTAEAVAGNGFYPGTVISVSCYQSGAANVPGSTDSMWERATWVSGPGSGNGWINEHFINDGSGINQPSPGVPPC